MPSLLSGHGHSPSTYPLSLGAYSVLAPPRATTGIVRFLTLRVAPLILAGCAPLVSFSLKPLRGEIPPQLAKVELHEPYIHCFDFKRSCETCRRNQRCGADDWHQCTQQIEKVFVGFLGDQAWRGVRDAYGSRHYWDALVNDEIAIEGLVNVYITPLPKPSSIRVAGDGRFDVYGNVEGSPDQRVKPCADRVKSAREDSEGEGLRRLLAFEFDVTPCEWTMAKVKKHKYVPVNVTVRCTWLPQGQVPFGTRTNFVYRIRVKVDDDWFAIDYGEANEGKKSELTPHKAYAPGRDQSAKSCDWPTHPASTVAATDSQLKSGDSDTFGSLRFWGKTREAFKLRIHQTDLFDLIDSHSRRPPPEGAHTAE
jgi:hypothetical protein